MSETSIQVTVTTEELREWAGRHADAGHHGVAHVLYKAAEGIESVAEQHNREVAVRAWSEGFKAGRRADHNPMWWPSNPYRADQIEEGA